jgi:imidazolonepropionase-like amidohydrolase
MDMTIAYKAKSVIAKPNEKILQDAYVLVADNKVTSVQKKIPKDFPVLDLGDVTLLPGLIDAHLHLMWTGEGPDPDYTRRAENSEMGMLRMADHARKSIAGGITTCRDVGGPTDMILALRKAVEMGLVPGPRIVSAGTLISMTGGHVNTISKEADGPDEVQKAAREILKAGADFLKLVASGGIYGHGEEIGSLQSDLEELSAAVREAHKVGKKAAAHVYPAKGIEICLDAGIDSIEHGSFLTPKLAKRMASQGAFIVPTLSVFQAMHSRQNEPTTLDFIRRKTAQVVEASKQAVKTAKAHKVRIGAGTDSGGPWHPHGSIVKEIEALVNAGLTTVEALSAATITNAEILGLDKQIGSIESGKFADFIAVYGNPLKDISAVKKLAIVVKGGVPVFTRSNYAKAISELSIVDKFLVFTEQRN